MIASKKKKLEQRIDEVENQLKDTERARWSLVETKKIKERGEQPADFFRIIYKLQMLERMQKFLRTNGYLVKSFMSMLNRPKENWGDILIKRKSRDYVNPEERAIRRNL